MFFIVSLSAVTERQPATHLGHDNKHNGRDDAATQQHQFDVFRPVRPSNLLRLPLKVDRLPAARARTHQRRGVDRKLRSGLAYLRSSVFSTNESRCSPRSKAFSAHTAAASYGLHVRGGLAAGGKESEAHRSCCASHPSSSPSPPGSVSTAVIARHCSRSNPASRGPDSAVSSRDGACRRGVGRSAPSPPGEHP